MGSDAGENWEGRAGPNRPRSLGEITGRDRRARADHVRDLQGRDRQGPRSPHPVKTVGENLNRLSIEERAYIE